MSRQITAVFPLLIAVLLALPRVADGALPGIADPNVCGERVTVERLLAFNRATMSDAYRSVGNHNAKWDTAAIAFTDATAARFSASGRNEQFWPAGVTENGDELLNAGKSLVDAGCDDPMVLYCYATALFDHNLKDEADAQLTRSFRGFVRSQYPAFRVLRAMAKMDERMHANHGGENVDEKLIEAMPDWARKVTESAEAKGPDRTRVFDVFASAVESGLAGPDTWEWYFEWVKDDLKADPWFMAMIAGKSEIRMAWKERTDAQADQVTPEALKGFYDHLAKAKTYFESAYKTHPDCPCAAAEMITVAMGAGGRLNVKPREWFEKAVKAQIDYGPAYKNFRAALLPRWGGSYEEMYSLALECLDHSRYDTALPFEYLNTLRDMRLDGDHVAWMRPGVYEKAKAVIDHYAGEKGAVRNRRWFTSLGFALSAETNHWSDVLVYSGAMGKESPDLGALSVMSLVPADDLVAKAHAFTGPQAGAIADANRLAAAGEFDRAADRLRAAGEALGKDDPGAGFCSEKIVELELRKELVGGDWVDVQPKQGLAGWRGVHGTWSVDAGGQLKGVADDKGLVILFAARAGAAYILRGKCTVINPPSNTGGGFGVADDSPNILIGVGPRTSLVGLFGAYVSDAVFDGMWTRPGMELSGAVNSNWDGGLQNKGDGLPDGSHALEARVAQHCVTGSDGGAVAGVPIDLGNFDAEDGRFGVGGVHLPAATIVIFRDLQARVISDP